MGEQTRCPVCRDTADVVRAHSRSTTLLVDCARCGNYRITQHDIANLEGERDEDRQAREKLSHALRAASDAAGPEQRVDATATMRRLFPA